MSSILFLSLELDPDTVGFDAIVCVVQYQKEVAKRANSSEYHHAAEIFSRSVPTDNSTHQRYFIVVFDIGSFRRREIPT